ncbi:MULTISPECIES: hypothetical protein [unclassified Streptomyces]|uniref:hypothetical protein n=1 Tax=Streptomyces sp. NPDC055082 TaxID=3365718 RepID=UPI0037CE439D
MLANGPVYRKAKRLTSTSRIAPTLEVVVEIVSSVEAGPAEPTKVSATVSNPLTGHVLSKASPTVVHEPDEVSNAAIGEAVEAVVTASAGESVESMATSQEPGGEFPDGLLGS